MKYLFYASLLLLLFTFSGCVKIINDDLEKKETKLVINAAISPDSIFLVNLSRTFNIFDDESSKNLPFIDDAEVKLYENGIFLTTLNNSGYGYYINPGFYPVVGNEYRVEASSGSYKSVESITVIPPAVPIVDFDTALISVTDEYNGKEIRYVGILKYNDPGGIDNQYQLSCKFLAMDSQGNMYWNKTGIWPLEGDERFFDRGSNGNLLWSDGYTDGNEVTVRFQFYSSYVYEEGKSRDTQKIHFLFSLQSINKDYYTYLKSVGIYWETGGSDNPFAEPVVIHSNVENGYGIFGGYSQDTVSTNLYFDTNGGIEGGKEASK